MAARIACEQMTEAALKALRDSADRASCPVAKHPTGEQGPQSVPDKSLLAILWRSFGSVTSTVELSLSGCRRQPCGGDALVDLLVDGAQCGAELGWGLGLAGGEQRDKDAVVDLGVEDRER